MRAGWRAGCGLLALALLANFVVACGGHTERTLPVRTALNEGRPRDAIAAIDAELDVQSPSQIPPDLASDNALLVLDRASIQQSLAQWKDSQNDFQAADKATVMLDLAHNAGDDIGKYIFSDSAGGYRAPPYEKLLINTLNMINYLEQGDVNGARIEARRMTVMQRYIVEQLHETENSVVGLGGFLAGFTFEKSGQADEALRYYDEALRFSGFGSLYDPVRALMQQGQYRSPRLKHVEEAGAGSPLPQPLGESNDGEIVFVVGYGRVPHKVSNRIPIGLALTYFAGAIHPTDAAAANKLAAQGLVTWVNYPSLAPEQGSYAIPVCQLDDQYVQLEESVNVSREVRVEWHKIEGTIVASAITRMIARYVAGEGARAVGNALGKGGGLLGELLSLGTQATLTALDTPDTRSWETLPSRLAIARVRVPAGKHSIMLNARGVVRRQEVDVAKGGWSVVSLMALR